MPIKTTDYQNYSLDVTRGVAVTGMLIVSIWQFGGFTQNQQIFYISGWHGGNYKLWAIVSMLFEGKMGSIFAMVFGAGIILFLQKKVSLFTISTADGYIRSQLWLLGFGIINAFILLWPGDILFNYGVMGIFLFAFARLNAKALLIAAMFCTIIYAGKNYWNYADDKKAYKKWKAIEVVEKKFKADSLLNAKKDSIVKKDAAVRSLQISDNSSGNKDSSLKKKDTLTRKQTEDKQAWEGKLKSFKYDSSNTKSENTSMRKSWPKVWSHLKNRAQYQESHYFYKTGVWEIGAMMLLGMALMVFGFFSLRPPSSRYLLIAAITIIAGLLLAWWRIKQTDARFIDYVKFIDNRTLPYNIFFPLERILMATGYVSALLWLLKLNFLGWIGKAFAAAGRMALTNYLLQTIICTFFFYGYGFSYFGRLQQWELYFFVCEVTLVQIAFSVFWLRYYQMGPMEWLWRSLVYRKWMPNKKG